MGRYELSIHPILINERWITRIVIDDHVKKHPEISDEIIKDLVKGLAWDVYEVNDRQEPYTYFAEYRLLMDKQYRLVWVFEDKQDYIGIITIFRDKKRK